MPLKPTKGSNWNLSHVKLNSHSEDIFSALHGCQNQHLPVASTPVLEERKKMNGKTFSTLGAMEHEDFGVIATPTHCIVALTDCMIEMDEERASLLHSCNWRDTILA